MRIKFELFVNLLNVCFEILTYPAPTPATVYATAYIAKARPTSFCVALTFSFIWGSSMASIIPVPMKQMRLSTNEEHILGD